MSRLSISDLAITSDSNAASAPAADTAKKPREGTQDSRRSCLLFVGCHLRNTPKDISELDALATHVEAVVDKTNSEGCFCVEGVIISGDTNRQKDVLDALCNSSRVQGISVSLRKRLMLRQRPLLHPQLEGRQCLLPKLLPTKVDRHKKEGP